MRGRKYAHLDVPPGAPWIPFDYLDFVIVVALSFGGHILINHTAQWLGIRDVKW